ncbi:unnamed protein product, partial [Strongylus vulgaris]
PRTLPAEVRTAISSDLLRAGRQLTGAYSDAGPLRSYLRKERTPDIPEQLRTFRTISLGDRKDLRKPPGSTHALQAIREDYSRSHNKDTG